jgi:phenylalanyl-tRNA synthetase beta chain
LKREKNDISYQTLSTYPFIVRDIAIFVPQEVSEEYIETLLKKEAGELVVRFSQFDKFQKPGESRISYAYRMVFQSFDRTLTDDEVGGIMERVTLACNAQKDWQVR